MTTSDPSEPRMQSLVLEIPPAEIAFFKAVVESYDNLVTLRTEDPIRHHLRVWFDPSLELDVLELLESFRSQFPLRVLMRG